MRRVYMQNYLLIYDHPHPHQILMTGDCLRERLIRAAPQPVWSTSGGDSGVGIVVVGSFHDPLSDPPTPRSSL